MIAEQQQVTPEHNQSTAPNTAQQMVSQNTSDQVKVLADKTLNSGSLPFAQTLQDGQYLIQISAMADNYLVQQFMQDNPLSQQVWTYTTQRFGGDWFVLLFNHVYPSLEHARAALDKLPSSISAYEPFVKSARQVKQELIQKGV